MLRKVNHTVGIEREQFMEGEIKLRRKPIHG